MQGVGFRPFVYNLAERLKLAGQILNNKLGVTIEIEGDEKVCMKFLDLLKNEAPPLARIADISAVKVEVKNERKFVILESDSTGDDVALISPDNDLCGNCLAELLDLDDRRYRYPFINCTDCGPRYTIINGTPYDRPFTSMKDFTMCGDCRAEYEDPKNRRFHAQPNACPVCGPSLILMNGEGEKEESPDPVKEVMRHISEGKIVAIKGLGGYHLACDATNETAVNLLRERKFRKAKPFAIMSKDVASIREFAEVNEQEERLLTSREKPIVLLQKKRNTFIAGSIAPGLNEYGVFLPYTPVHHLMFAETSSPAAIVMTSGNISDEPIVFEEEALMERLGGIADYYLSNNRPIVWRCDDSVAKTFGDKTMIARRSRGWVPSPVFIEKKSPPLLACGGDLKSVFSLARGNTVFPGPHVGDLENAEAFNSFQRSISHFKKIFGIEPELVAVDSHPGYFSSNYGRSLGLPIIEIQHHHAHIASVMLENKLNGEVIGLAMDGAGFGPDSTVWGGEALLCSMKEYKRKFHLPLLKLPGGDIAAKEPWRTAVALLYSEFGDRLYDKHPSFVNSIGESKVKNMIAMIKNGINTPLSSSAGRLFDAISSILMICHHNRYEGEAPILLQAIADSTITGSYSFETGKTGEISFPGMLDEILEVRHEPARASALFHNTIANAMAECCISARKESGVADVCLGGGTFQSSLLLARLYERLELEGFNVYLPRQLPVNDGGLSLGQVAIALAGT